MSLRFVPGRAGSGKTCHCLASIARRLEEGADGPLLIFLVPEQATFQMERALLIRMGGRAYSRARVLSFRRLTHWVFSQVGGPAVPPIGDVQRRLLLRLILRRRLHDLEVFGRAAGQPGFETEVARLISEFLRQRICPDALRAATLALEARDPGDAASHAYLSAKVRDLALLLDDYQHEIAGRFTNPEEEPDYLAQILRRHPILKGACLWVDGFASFSSQELYALGEILAQVETADICLCLDPQEVEPRDSLRSARSPQSQDIRLFAEPLRTWHRLRGLAMARRVPLLDPLALPERETDTRFSRSRDLAHLEHEYPNPQPHPWTSAVSSVRLVEAASPRAQAEAVARELLRLHRVRHYRWRDMAILTRSLDENLSILVPALREHGIPHFLDRRRSLDSHPLVTALRAATRILFQGWNSPDVIEFLKTGLSDLEPEAIDRLENYVLEHGLAGREAWTRPDDWAAWPRRRLDEEESWEPDEPDRERQNRLARLNESRHRVVDCVAGWERQFLPQTPPPDPVPGASSTPETPEMPNVTGKSLALALAALLRRLDVVPRLEAWERSARELGDSGLAEEHRQALPTVLDALSELALALGDEALTPREGIEVVEATLANLQIGVIPGGLDEVSVGSVDRSRQPELKACLVIGLAEGEFPGGHAQDPLLTDPEREILRSHGCEVTPPSIDLFLNESYLAYVAFTRAAEWLWVARPTGDERGEELVASPFWKRLRSIFPNRVPEEARATDTGWDNVATPQQWLVQFGEQVRASPGAEQDLVEFLVDCPSLRSAVRARQGKAPHALRDTFLPVHPQTASPEALFARHLAAIPSGPAVSAESVLDPVLAQRALLDGTTLPVSLTQVEAFTRCPFQHFAAYILRLEERPEYRVELVDLGSLYHAVLKLWVGRALRDGVDLASVSEDDLQRALRGLTDAVAPRLKNELLLSNARFRYIIEMVKETLVQAARTIAASLQQGTFRPFGVEVGFGGRERDLKPLEIPLSGGRQLRFRGRVDRVDTAAGNPGEIGVCVVDYKMSSRKLDLARVYYGLDLQLGGYLLALTRNPSARQRFAGQPVAVGAFYMPVRADAATYVHPDDLARESGEFRHAQRRLHGIFRIEWVDRLEVVRPQQSGVFHQIKRNKDGGVSLALSECVSAEAMDRILDHVASVLRQSGEDMLHGRIPVAPAQYGSEMPCDFCPFAAVCRFDNLLSETRILPKLGRREAALDALLKGGNRGT